MKKIFILPALLVSAYAYAQNLNPVVEVTNVYAMEASGIEKPEQLLPLPDSVFKFNLDFDYSVKSTPYKGAYEFNPYLVQMRPSARLSREQTFYLKAGAGYSFHPEVDVVWNPVRTQNFRLDLYASHNSYMGKYRNVTIQEDKFLWDGTNKADGGMRSLTNAGADFLYAYKSGQFTADLQYANVLATDYYLSDETRNLAHHKGQARLRVQSNPGTKFIYNVGTRIAYLGYDAQKEFHTVSDASLGFRVGKRSNFRLGAGLETVSYGEESALKFEIMPHYSLGTKRLNLDLGFKFSYVSSGVTEYPQKGGILFPDVYLSYRIADAVVLQASATGGDRLTSYDSLLDDNPYLGGFIWHRDVIVNRVNLMVGMRGSAGGRFSYDIRAGYNWTDNAYGWSWLYKDVLNGDGLAELVMQPTMVYVSPLRTLYVDAKFAWNSSNWDILAFVHYGHTPKPNLETEVEQNVFVPAAFKAQGHIFYKWGGRIKVGPTIEASSKMRGRIGIPAYQDLGIYAEYALGRKMAVWAKGGNLLNQTIQRTPFYAEGGIYGTLGIKLQF